MTSFRIHRFIEPSCPYFFKRTSQRTRRFSSVKPLQFDSHSSSQAVERGSESLHGTVASHRCYVLLDAPEPPSLFPQRFTTPVQRALQLRLTKLGGIVNFAWHGPNNKPLPLTPGAHCATAFTPLGGRLEIPEVSLENINEVEQMFRKHMEGPLTRETQTEIHLYVCTHGARDCRCGESGGQLVKALRTEVEKANLHSHDSVPRIHVGEVGHVGGHKYAANMLVFPHGEWLGLLKPDNISDLLSALLKLPPRPYQVNDPPLMISHWRGRMGLNKEEQLELYSSHL